MQKNLYLCSRIVYLHYCISCCDAVQPHIVRDIRVFLMSTDMSI